MLQGIGPQQPALTMSHQGIVDRSIATAPRSILRVNPLWNWRSTLDRCQRCGLGLLGSGLNRFVDGRDRFRLVNV